MKINIYLASYDVISKIIKNQTKFNLPLFCKN